MGLRITAAVDYAIRGMVHLACLDPETPALRGDIAETCNVPPAFMAKILRRLSAAGLLESVRGAGGGFRVGRPTSEITLLDIVVAIEGPLAVAPCASCPCGCPVCGQCPADTVWQQVQQAIESSLTAHTLEDLVSQPHQGRSRPRPSLAVSPV